MTAEAAWVFPPFPLSLSDYDGKELARLAPSFLFSGTCRRPSNWRFKFLLPLEEVEHLASN